MALNFPNYPVRCCIPLLIMRQDQISNIREDILPQNS